MRQGSSDKSLQSLVLFMTQKSRVKVWYYSWHRYHVSKFGIVHDTDIMCQRVTMVFVSNLGVLKITRKRTRISSEIINRILFLTLSWRRPLSYRNQSIDLRSKSMNWYLYDNGLRHEKVKNKFFWSYTTF